MAKTQTINYDSIEEFVGKKNRLLIDWFSFTLKFDFEPLQEYVKLYRRKNFTFSDELIDESTLIMVDFVRDFLKLPIDCHFEHSHGSHGYNDKIYFNGINVNYNPSSENMGIWFEFSGKGCRAFDEFSGLTLQDLISYVVAFTEIKLANITRLDMAYDDFTGIFDIDTIFFKVFNGEYRSKTNLRSFSCEYSDKGKTVYVGSNKSNVLVRFYDKAAEQKLVDVHWVRCEIQFRNSHALGYCKLIDCDAGALFRTIVDRYVTFLEPSKTDSNKSRWAVSPFWSEFLDDVELNVSIYSKVRRPPELKRLVDYVEKKCANSIDAYCKIFGLEYFINKVMQPYGNMNPNYELLIKDCGLLDNVNGDFVDD